MNQVLRKPVSRGKVGKVLLSHMQKPCKALADGRKSVWKRIESKQWTYFGSFMSKTWLCFLVPFYCFFCFLIRNFNWFCSYFYHCNWPENFHHHAYPRLHANHKWLIFPATMLIPGAALTESGSSFPPPLLFRATRLFGREEQLLGTKGEIRSQRKWAKL